MSKEKDFLLDKYVKQYNEKVNTGSVGVSWIDGRCIFNPTAKHAGIWFGICHYSNKVWAVAPIDFDRITAVNTIKVSFTEEYCEKAHVCLNFMCEGRNPVSGRTYRLNKFNKGMYVSEFKDVGFSSLGLRTDIGTKDLWFNEKKYNWENIIKEFKPDGVVLKFNEYK